MSLNFRIGSISNGVRSVDSNTSFLECATVILGECIETLETEIKVTNLPASGCGKTEIRLEYFEKYEPGITFAEFNGRAEDFARNYCSILGIE